MAKSKGVAYLIWLFLGLFGGHKFYLGKIGQGLIMMFTGGGCGVWWMINLFTLSGEVDVYNARYTGSYGKYNQNNSIVVNVNTENNKSIIGQSNTHPVTGIYENTEKGNFLKKEGYKEDIRFEYIDFNVAGTSFRQNEIKKAISLEQEGGVFFSEKYQGMTNKEILEDTFDEPIFQYHDDMFSDCYLKPEPENEHDTHAVAVYIQNLKVGYVPKKNFKEGKEHIFNKLLNKEDLHLSLSLKGGKYKVNRGDEKVETGETNYRLEGQIVIRNNK